MLFDQQRFMRLSDHIWRSSFQKILGIWPFSCDMCKYIYYYLYSIDCACIVCHSGAQKQIIVQLYIDIASSNTTLPNNWLFIFFLYTIFFFIFPYAYFAHSRLMIVAYSILHCPKSSLLLLIHSIYPKRI